MTNKGIETHKNRQDTANTVTLLQKNDVTPRQLLVLMFSVEQNKITEVKQKTCINKLRNMR